MNVGMEPSVVKRFNRWAALEANLAHEQFPDDHWDVIEKLLPGEAEFTAETGCGRSTVLFSNFSQRHLVFAHDDREQDNSSVALFDECPLSKKDRVELNLGPTQITLPHYQFDGQLDVVMLAGPHAYPFPDLEYYYLYRWIKTGGLLIVDAVNIPTLARMADFIAEDDMFDVLEVVKGTAIFRRTEAPTFDPVGDGWWEQSYNRRRVSKKRGEFLADEAKRDAISSLELDKLVCGEQSNGKAKPGFRLFGK